MKKKSVRLPSHIRPERYRLIIKPDIKGFVFTGQETIFLILDKSVPFITLHSKDLKISQAGFVDRAGKKSGQNFPATRISYDEKQETATLFFEKALPRGRGELFLEFEGELNDKMHGFYRSRYTHKGQEKYLATTQFEATDARRAFPCFDEPSHKAVFDVTILAQKDHMVISNTIESEVVEHEGGVKAVTFQPTPKMSTYLLAFIVGDFEFIEAKTKGGVTVRIFTTPGKKQQGKFALDCAVRSLEYYENYFNIKYPLPILDLIAVPDFQSGAMENWGAITFRETALLVDEKHTSASTQQWVAIVVAHEIAHMWFGNLVTMRWWTDLWLNEGFASFMEYKCVDHLFPEWEMWDQYVAGRFDSALRLDSLTNTHPIEVEVHHPDEISEIFDMISYAKGSSVIRMLEDYLGEKDFRKGLREYLKTHAYKNTRTSDLWESLQKASGKPVKEVMKSWTKTPGYPVVSITEKPASLVLKQERFYLSRLERPQKQTWMVPVSVGKKKYMLDSKSLEIPKPTGQIKLNTGETGFFRTDYPAQILAKLKKPILNKTLPVVDRFGILRDTFSLVESARSPLQSALDLLWSFRQEDSLVVWEQAAGIAYRLLNLFSQEKFIPQLENFLQTLFEPIAEKVGWQGNPREGQQKKLLRSLALNALGSFGHQPTLQKAHKLFRSGKQIHIDVRSAVYNAVARQGKAADWQKLAQAYEKAPTHEEQERIGRALASFSEPALVKKTLTFALSSKVRSQDAPFIIATAFSNPYAKQTALDFCLQNWQTLYRRFGSGLKLHQRIIMGMGSLADKASADRIVKFFRKHSANGAERTLKQVKEKILSNDAWLRADRGHMEAWLNKFNQKTNE
jgi:puromycin-sensitive aminopeptidase